MIAYFVLKDRGGKTAGCVRLENDRARSSCPCTLLLEDGTVLDLSPEETSLPARALGAAVLRGDALAAWGTPPGVKLTGTELLYRLKRKPTPGIEPGPGPEIEPGSGLELEPGSEPEPKLESEPEPVSGLGSEPEAEWEIGSDAAGPEESAARAADFGLLVQHAEEVYDSILNPPLPEVPAAETPEIAEPPKADWFSETEGLLSRLRRRSS